MLYWLADITKEIVIAMATGAYTGLVVTKYMNIKALKESARARVNRIPDLMEEVFNLRMEPVAQGKVMALFLDQASACKSEGYFINATAFWQLSKTAEGDLIEIWRQVRLAKETRNVDALNLWIDKIIKVVNGCNAAIDKIEPDWLVLLFGTGIGLRIRRANHWAKRCLKYLNGESEKI